MSTIRAQISEPVTAAQLADLYNRLSAAVNDVRADIEITAISVTISEVGENVPHREAADEERKQPEPAPEHHGHAHHGPL